MIDKFVLKEVVNKLDGDYSSLKLLGGFNDSVYEVKVNDKSFVIKFFLMSQTNKSLIKGELDWINYLSENGMNVAKPVFPVQDNFIKEISENAYSYYYVIFEKVEGRFIDEEGWKENLIQNWGQAMGKMHNLAKNYKPSCDGSIKKWIDNDILIDPPSLITDLVLDKWNKYVEKIKSLPISEDSYGIIHNDLHHKNIYFNNGEVILFDFGDCEYSWFSYDISISLYHAIQRIPLDQEEYRLDFANKFMKNFMIGYKQENSIDYSWLKEIEFFLDYRHIYSYLYILKHLNINDTDNRLKEFLEGMKNRIEEGIPYLKGLNLEQFI